MTDMIVVESEKQTQSLNTEDNACDDCNEDKELQKEMDVIDLKHKEMKKAHATAAMLKMALPKEQCESATQDFMKNHKTELPSTCMHEKDDKLEFQVKNIVIPNDPDTVHDTNEMEEEELVQEEDNANKKKIDDRKTDNKKIVNTEVRSYVAFQKALELFALH